MKISSKLILAAAAVALSAQSCTFVRFNINSQNLLQEAIPAEGDSTTETYQVADFTGLVCDISADITYRMTEGEASVSLYAPENYHDYINCDVVDGILTISVDQGKKLSHKNRIKVELASSVLTDVTTNGAARFCAPDGIDSETFSLTIHGAAEATVSGLRCAEANITIQGAGDVDVTGIEADSIDCLIQGASDLKLSGKAESASITVNGAGDINIDALEVNRLKTNVKGLSNQK